MYRYFSENEIEKILSEDKVKKYDKKSLDIRTNEIFKYFASKNIDNENIRQMIIDFPRLLTYSTDFLNESYNNLENIFNKNINKIIIVNSRILIRNKEYVDKRIKFLMEYFTDEQIVKKICLKCPTIFTLSELNIEISIKNLEEKINDRSKLIYLLKTNPNILSFTNKRINEKIDWFYKKGYTKKEISKIITKATSLLTMEIETNIENKEGNIEQKYNYLLNDLKYNEEEIIDITNNFPIYYTLSLNTTKNRINNLIRLGFGMEMVKYIFYNFPQIISFKTSTLNEKYNYYEQLDMLDIFIKNPKYLMQNLELTDARYTYLIRKGLEVNKNNYSKLFVSSKRFKENYGIDNEELLNKNKEKEGYYEQRRNKTNTNRTRTRTK